MARVVVAASAVIVAAGLCCGDVAERFGGGPPAGESRFVTASSLHLRADASAASASLVEMPRGATVVVTDGPRTADTALGITGEWVPVWYGGQRGYAFDGFLLPVKPPPERCIGLQQWAETIGYAGPAVPLGSTPCQQMGIGTEGMCDENRRQPLAGGGFHQVNSGYEWGSDTLHLVGVRRDAVWAAARACFAGPPDLRKEPLPTVGGEVPRLQFPDGTVTAQVDGQKAGWEYPQGCWSYVYVTQVGDDVEIISGGGC